MIKLVLFIMTFTITTYAARTPSSSGNPLVVEWKGEFGGLPPFDQVKVADFKSAFVEVMESKRQELRAITDNLTPATFDNTIAALERAGQALNRVSAVYEVWSGSMSGPQFIPVENEIAPLLSAFQDEIFQNIGLFKRIETVYNSPKKNELSSEEQRLVWFYYTQFISNGARLNKTQKIRVVEINKQLASLSTQFRQNQLADEENDVLVLDKLADLAGLPQAAQDAAAAEAKSRGLSKKWVIANTRSSMEPFLTYSTNRALREKAFRKWSFRGDNGDKNDNNKIVVQILKLRTERSKILGYKTYAHWHLADTMAKDPQAAMALMLKVWKPAVAQVHKDVAEMQSLVDAEKGNFKIQPWDYRYYAEKVRKAKYDLDFELVKHYLQLENIREAMFWMAKQVYGFTFIKLKGVQVFNESMSVYKVVGRDNLLVGLWYFDPYARAGKRSGAWMSTYRGQHKMDGLDIKPIVSNNTNFIPTDKPNEPVLISWGDAVTMFHEFGHALHGLDSNVIYPSLTGPFTAGDFVEYPSHIHENYLATNEVLKFLTNKNGKPLPMELIEKINNAKYFNQGFDTVEFLASAIIDMKLHLAGDISVDLRAFEKKELAKLGMPAEIIMRHRIPHFGHLFSDEGYAARYYGYLWAQVLAYDTWEAFIEAGGPYDKAVTQRFHENIMSVGNTVDPAVAFRKFRGRDAKADALLRARGFL